MRHISVKCVRGGERGRSGAAENRSTTCMEPPQTRQFQRVDEQGRSASCDAVRAEISAELASNWKHSGRSEARCPCQSLGDIGLSEFSTQVRTTALGHLDYFIRKPLVRPLREGKKGGHFH
ncbi:MAG: hypothetical protein QOE55_7348 [Acidobacteriaceae bacterium]|jgi:hypothetical protein|nr:hypothetical protein [Acidobacteriaceae bacterium]